MLHGLQLHLHFLLQLHLKPMLEQPLATVGTAKETSPKGDFVKQTAGSPPSLGDCDSPSRTSSLTDNNIYDKVG